MTPSAIKTLDYVRECIAATGTAPTLREIAAHERIPLGRTYRHVNALVEKGYLLRRRSGWRGLEIADATDLRGVPTDQLRCELARRGVTLEALQVRDARAVGCGATCAADTCGVAVERGHLMCRTHWFSLPRDLRDALLAAFAAARRTRSPDMIADYQSLVTTARDRIDGGRM